MADDDPATSSFTQLGELVLGSRFINSSLLNSREPPDPPRKSDYELFFAFDPLFPLDPRLEQPVRYQGVRIIQSLSDISTDSIQSNSSGGGMDNGLPFQSHSLTLNAFGTLRNFCTVSALAL